MFLRPWARGESSPPRRAVRLRPAGWRSSTLKRLLGSGCRCWRVLRSFTPRFFLQAAGPKLRASWLNQGPRTGKLAGSLPPRRRLGQISEIYSRTVSMGRCAGTKRCAVAAQGQISEIYSRTFVIDLGDLLRWRRIYSRGTRASPSPSQRSSPVPNSGLPGTSRSTRPV